MGRAFQRTVRAAAALILHRVADRSRERTTARASILPFHCPTAGKPCPKAHRRSRNKADVRPKRPLSTSPPRHRRAQQTPVQMLAFKRSFGSLSSGTARRRLTLSHLSSRKRALKRSLGSLSSGNAGHRLTLSHLSSRKQAARRFYHQQVR